MRCRHSIIYLNPSIHPPSPIPLDHPLKIIRRQAKYSGERSIRHSHISGWLVSMGTARYPPGTLDNGAIQFSQCKCDICCCNELLLTCICVISG
ncbi:hypothetical protein NPIL_191351 [Nephila pilipes]|uniref:Uncharacterized protein n=1 Tax=Nephila pilipes TaxID=299642 RepID=A0A8X6MWY6_NEPPI|nr:hypothetical protein NPIL_191351 [Nephila pilipes]